MLENYDDIAVIYARNMKDGSKRTIIVLDSGEKFSVNMSVNEVCEELIEARKRDA